MEKENRKRLFDEKKGIKKEDIANYA